MRIRIDKELLVDYIVKYFFKKTASLEKCLGFPISKLLSLLKGLMHRYEVLFNTMQVLYVSLV
jgi:hypothetical protein